MSNSFSSVGGNLQSHNIRSNFGTTRQDHIIQKIAEEMEQKEIKEKWPGPKNVLESFQGVYRSERLVWN